MRAYSVDLRERVVAAVDRNMPRTEVATTFGVSLATIKRWLVRRRTTGTLPHRRRLGGHRRSAQTSTSPSGPNSSSSPTRPSQCIANAGRRLKACR